MRLYLIASFIIALVHFSKAQDCFEGVRSAYDALQQAAETEDTTVFLLNASLSNPGGEATTNQLVNITWTGVNITLNARFRMITVNNETVLMNLKDRTIILLETNYEGQKSQRLNFQHELFMAGIEAACDSLNNGKVKVEVLNETEVLDRYGITDLNFTLVKGELVDISFQQQIEGVTKWVEYEFLPVSNEIGPYQTEIQELNACLLSAEACPEGYIVNDLRASTPNH